MACRLVNIFVDQRSTRQMGKDDIKDWIASSGHSGNDADDEEQAKYWEDARNDWPRFVQLAQTTMHSSSTKGRAAFIEEHLLPLCKSGTY